MADALYLKVMEALGKDPSSGGVDPREFGWPGLGPNPTQDFSVPDEYLAAQQQMQPPSPEAPSPPPFQMQAPRRKIGILQRPQQFVSELLMRGDPMAALLKGRATTETLGREIFSGAQEKGFQAADLPAFMVDVLSDPLTFLLPPLMGRSFKAIGSLFGKSTSVKFFSNFIEDAMARTGGKAQRAALHNMWKPFDNGGLGMTSEWFREIAIKAGIQAEGVAYQGIDDIPDKLLPQLMSYMQNIKYNIFEPSSGFFGQALNRAGMHLAPVVNVLRNQGGVWGQRLGDGIEKVMNGTLENYASVATGYLKYIDDLGLSSPSSAPILEAGTILAEAGGMKAGIDDIIRIVEQHGDVPEAALKILFSGPTDKLSQAMKAGGRLREIFDEYSGILSGFKDAHGKGFMIQTGGKKGLIPFHEGIIPNYVAHTFNWNELKVGSQSYKQFVKNFMKTKGVKNYAEAEDIIETMIRKTPKKFGNIEHARLFNMPGYNLNPLEFLPQWLYRTEYRMNFAKQFGVNGTGATQLINAVKKEGLDSKWVSDVGDILFDRHKINYPVQRIIQKMTGFQVLTKMGFGSMIANLSQSINTMAIFGISNFMKGVANTYTDEGAKFGALAWNRVIKEATEEMITGATSGGPATKYLDATGFNWAEKWNRFFGANTGVAALKNWGAQLSKVGLESPQGQRIAARLTRTLNMTQDDLVRLASQPPGRELLNRAALNASNNTQHATMWHQLPKMWQIPEARLMLQYKNFAYNQARFIHRQILGPAMEFLATNGAKGDIAPLARAVPLFTTAGQAVGHLRDLMRIPIRGVLQGDWEAREEWLWNQDEEWFSSMIKDSFTVGSLGMMGDMFTAAQRGKLPQWAIGPTFGDISDLATRTLGLTTARDLPKSFDQFSTWMGRRMVPPALSLIPGTIPLLKTALGATLAGVAQQYPYDLTYGDIDMTRFIRDLEKLRGK